MDFSGFTMMWQKPYFFPLLTSVPSSALTPMYQRVPILVYSNTETLPGKLIHPHPVTGKTPPPPRNVKPNPPPPSF